MSALLERLAALLEEAEEDDESCGGTRRSVEGGGRARLDVSGRDAAGGLDMRLLCAAVTGTEGGGWENVGGGRGKRAVPDVAFSTPRGEPPAWTVMEVLNVMEDDDTGVSAGGSHRRGSGGARTMPRR
jgi:hypothetical protein